MSVILCPHCGTSNRVGSNFCNACGTDLRGGDDVPSDRGTRDVAPPSSFSSSSSPSSSPVPPASGGRARSDEEQPWLADMSDPEREDGEENDWPIEPDEDEDEWTYDGPAGFDRDDAGGDESGEAGGGFEDDADEGAEEAEEEGTDEDDFDEDDLTGRSGPRLITGVQGLLDPIRVSRQLAQGEAAPGFGGRSGGAGPGDRQGNNVPGEGTGLESLRRFRELFYEEPRLGGNRRRLPVLPKQPHLWIPWLFLAVAIVVGVPLALGLGGTGGNPPLWPGVAEAHTVIDSLPPDALVLIYWAYDPATAGELNLAARPVIRHLLERRARLVGVSPLPTGPATARRVVEEIRQSRAQSGVFSVAGRNPWPVLVEYLPGGTSTLPLMATQLGMALGPVYAPVLREAQARPPALAVVFAAQAEDAQHWLEQVHVRNGTPVVAVVSAAADPILRPYWDSGQLRGLVSGFAGAFHYQARLDPQESRSEGLILRSHVAGQNWAHLAILLALALGNLAAIMGRSAGQE